MRLVKNQEVHRRKLKEKPGKKQMQVPHLLLERVGNIFLMVSKEEQGQRVGMTSTKTMVLQA